MPRRKKPTNIFEDKQNLFNFFRLGESYTSLILGIIVVIVGTVLLLSLARTRTDAPQTSSANVSRTVTNITDNGEEIVISSNNGKSEESSADKKETDDVKPKASIQKGSTYEVREGDDLWSIADRAYKSGYNWVDIARANKLSNPNSIEVGQKLSIPKAEQKSATDEPEWTGIEAQDTKVESAKKIEGNQYTIEKGDNLWEIAVRAYGDGYKWTEIAKENKIENPDIIYSGNKLKIPRS